MFKQKTIKIVCVALAVMVALCAPLTASASSFNYDIKFFDGTYTDYKYVIDITNYSAAGTVKRNNSTFFYMNWRPESSNPYLLLDYWLDEKVSIPANSTYKFTFNNDLYFYDSSSSIVFTEVYFDFVFLNNSRETNTFRVIPKLTKLNDGYKFSISLDTFISEPCEFDSFRIGGKASFNNFKNSVDIYGFYSLNDAPLRVYCGPDTAEQDYEKETVQNSGNDSIDGVTGAMPNIDTSGLQNSVENLVDSMSYNGTDCIWTFPALKIPAIGGVVPEIKLSEEKPIDISSWVKKIPGPVLMILQACCSIAVVLFIIYEMYSFIIYCMTLRRNQVGKDEESED